MAVRDALANQSSSLFDAIGEDLKVGTWRRSRKFFFIIDDTFCFGFRA